MIEVPYGAHPCLMPYRYYFDEGHIKDWMTRSKTVEGTAEYFDEYVFGVEAFEDYLTKVGGLRKLHQLKMVEQLRA